MSVAIVHLSLTESDDTNVELRYWQDDRNQFTARTLLRAEIADLARKSEADYYSVSEPDLVDMGQRLYRWLDGTDRWLDRALASCRGADAVALAIACEGPLAHLPWETLHDGTTFLVHGAGPPVLPLRWKEVGPETAAPANRALNVLFMATNPLGIRPELNYEEEEGRILEATGKYHLSLTVEETGTLEELADLVRGHDEGHFDILHFTGHADHKPEGPRFLTESATGSPVWSSAEDLARAVPRKPFLTFLSQSNQVVTGSFK